jgi:single-strand DNA-binding protein
MATDIMTVTGVCRLTNDPYMNDAGNFLSLRVAYNTRTNEGGEWGEKGNFINAVMFGDRCAKLEPYLKKGGRIGITGRLEMNTYTDRDDNERTETRIAIQDVQLLDGPREDGGGSSSGNKRSSGGGDGWR